MWNIAYGREKSETAQDTKGMQTMHTLAHMRNFPPLLAQKVLGLYP